MTELTNRVRLLEVNLKSIIEQCGLPPIIVDLVLTNILNQVKNIEEKEVDANADIHQDNVGEQSGTID